MNPDQQIKELQAKIAEKLGSNDKMDLWLVKHWGNELLKIKNTLQSKTK